MTAGFPPHRGSLLQYKRSDIEEHLRIVGNGPVVPTHEDLTVVCGGPQRLHGRQDPTAVTGCRIVGAAELLRVLQDAVRSVDTAQNILVIKTVSGMAMAVAAALDAMNLSEVVGSIAGDDTIIIVTRSIEESSLLAGEIKNIM